VQIANGAITRPDRLQIETLVAPARNLQLLGSLAGSAQHETWALGTSSAGPAAVDGERLPYTAPGAQIVLLRYTDDGGWQIIDVLRNQDGSPFQQSAGATAIGSMLPDGEAWVVVRQPDGGTLFHRDPGGEFRRDPDASGALDAITRTSLTNATL